MLIYLQLTTTMKGSITVFLCCALSACQTLTHGTRTTFPGPSNGPKTSFPTSQKLPGLPMFSEPESSYSLPQQQPSAASSSTVMFPNTRQGKGIGSYDQQQQASSAQMSTVNFPNTRQGKAIGPYDAQPASMVPSSSVNLPNTRHHGKSSDDVVFPSATEGPSGSAQLPRQGKAFSFPSAGNRAQDINLPLHEPSRPAGFGRATGMPDARALMGALLGLGQTGLPAAFGNVNMSDIAVATNRVTDELSRSLRVDVRAVSKALAVGGAAMGTIVFLSGMAAMIMSGLGYFNYPELYQVHPYSTTYGTSYGNQYRTAKSLNGNADKKSVNPNLVPAINDLIGKLAKATQQLGTPK